MPIRALTPEIFWNIRYERRSSFEPPRLQNRFRSLANRDLIYGWRHE
jgi:hypothetical protein